ncbi:hypothetical protein J2S46_000425 [Kitasatospora herbaricolor]|nr:hypothetical protein [Kitasatospora herbaricolor]
MGRAFLIADRRTTAAAVCKDEVRPGHAWA